MPDLRLRNSSCERLEAAIGRGRCEADLEVRAQRVDGRAIGGVRTWSMLNAECAMPKLNHER